jgi:hypothetical protein
MTKNQKTIAIVGGVALLLYFLMKRKGAEKSLEEGGSAEGESQGGGGGGFGGGSPVGVPIGGSPLPPVTIVNNPPTGSYATQNITPPSGQVVVGQGGLLAPKEGLKPIQGSSVTNVATEVAKKFTDFDGFGNFQDGVL